MDIINDDPRLRKIIQKKTSRNIRTKIKLLTMKRKLHKLALGICLIMVVSCNEPETVITNYIHPDGSVTKRCGDEECSKNNFELSSVYRFLLISTWIITDSIEINENGDDYNLGQEGDEKYLILLLRSTNCTNRIPGQTGTFPEMLPSAKASDGSIQYSGSRNKLTRS